MQNRDSYWRRYKIQETMYIGQWHLSPFKVCTVAPHTVPVTISCLSYFPEFHQWSKISSLAKVILVLGKARSHRAPNLCCRRSESPGWFDVSPKKFCTRRDAGAGALLWWSYQSPVARSCGLLNHTYSFCREMFKLNAKFGASSLLYALSHFECNGYTVHMLTQ